MTRDEAVAEIKQGLGFRSDRTTEIVSALQQVQKQREGGKHSLPWFLLAEDQSFAILDGVRNYTLPTGFLGEVEEKDGNLRYVPSGSNQTLFLAKMDREGAEVHFYGRIIDDPLNPISSSADSPGSPAAYVLQKSSIRIYPEPDANYTLTWSFFKSADLLTTNIENSWLQYAPWCLIGDAGVKMAMNTRDKDALVYFQTVRDRGDQDLMGEIVERELRGRPLAMGSRL